jgi:site-specific DNA recombinase
VRNTQRALLKGLLYCGSCHVAMSHAWTRKKNKRRYRYYVCGRAQKESWDVCPVKAIPAGEIEQYVIDEIRRIGKDEGLVEKTFEAVGAEANRQVHELEGQAERLTEQLIQRTEEMQRIAVDRKTPPKTLAALQDRIAGLERDITAIRQKLMSVRREVIDKADVARAMSLFDPVWQHLSKHERVKALNQLIEKIVFDAESSTVAITFRETGIRDLLDARGVRTEDESGKEVAGATPNEAST